MTDYRQVLIDNYYRQHSPCCAGCDYWRWHHALENAPMKHDAHVFEWVAWNAKKGSVWFWFPLKAEPVICVST